MWLQRKVTDYSNENSWTYFIWNGQRIAVRVYNLLSVELSTPIGILRLILEQLQLLLQIKKNEQQ